MTRTVALIAVLLVTTLSFLHGSRSLQGDEPLRLSDGRPAPEYSVIAKLPPNKVEGFFMAPSLVKLPSGNLLAAVPVGLAYPDGGRGLRLLRFYRSTDAGANWKQVCELPHDSCEPNLLVCENRLYLLITPNGNNNKIERSNFPRDGKWGLWASVSDDEGVTWSPIKRVIEGPTPAGRPAPMLNTGGQTAMAIRRGKLYLSISDQFQQMAAVSCRLDQGILEPKTWSISEMVEMPIPRELEYEPFQGATQMRVLEGNVVEVSGRLLVIARAIINRGGTGNMGAVFEIVDRPGEPLRLQFLQLYPIPGGQLKFYIEHDATSRLYWMASNLPANPTFLIEGEAWSKARQLHASPSDRRSLTLWYSLDSLNWFPAGWVARAQGWTQSFHYPVMLIDGDDLILISRTGRDSGNQHDVDMATFHRITNFRKLAVDLTPTFPEVVAAQTSADDSALTEQVNILKKLGARITLDDQNRVIGVNLGERRVTDADLVHLRGLEHLQELDLTRTKITGAGLTNLKDVKVLRKLYLTDTKVDDSAIVHLQGMKSLGLLGLSGTKISDAALGHLEGLAELKQVFCLGTNVTDAGVKKLQRALPGCDVTY